MESVLPPALLDRPWLTATVGMILLFVVAWILYAVTRRYLVALLRIIVNRTRAEWDGVFFEARVPHRAALLVPLFAIHLGLPWIPGLPVWGIQFIDRLLSATLILVIALIITACIGALHGLYLRLPVAGKRPIKSYIQLANLAVYLVAGVFIVAKLADQSPWFFVTGLGAMMAVILLIFRDTLLSLVASIQLTNNDLVRVGDWIEMPQFGADGDVVDIALHTVTVQNWDKTVTVVPTHKFLEHSFKNWRHMFEAGGRRIKRAIHINTSTIRFLTDAEVERFSRHALLQDYMKGKVAELEEFNAAHAAGPDVIAHARRLTNIGTLRAYIIAYLRGHPGVNQKLTFMVRQLEPTPEGLPLQIYVFTNDTRWAYYEGIQADIFDHILAIVPEFGLSVYQRPSGRDLLPAVAEGD